MKNWSQALRDHYASDVTTLTTCWKATLQNGRIVAATKLDRDLVIDGITYQSIIGYLDSDVESSAELNPDNLEVDGFLMSPAITDADIHSGAWDYAAIEMFEVNYNDLTMGKNVLRTGTLGEVKGGRIKFTAELRGLMQAYTRTIVRLMTKDCNADLGDSRCKVDMSAWTATGSVGGTNSTNSVIYDAGRTEAGPSGAKAITGISQAASAVATCPGHGFAQNATVQLSDIIGCTLSGATKDGVFYAGSGDGLNGMLFQIKVIDADHFSILVDTRGYNSDPTQGVTDPLQVYSPYVSGGLAHPANASGYFDHGTITFYSGANAGLSMEVKAYAPGVITLMLPMPFEIAPGNAYVIQAGCNQAFETCQQRFNNVVNFRGFPNLPQSKIYRRGAEGVGTDGSSVSGSGTGGSGGTGGTGGGTGGGTSGGGSTPASGTLTGILMPNSVDSTFEGQIPGVVFPASGTSDGYFAVDLSSPTGAKLLGHNKQTAKGLLVGTPVSSQTAISGAIRPITAVEIATYLNSIRDYRYDIVTTTVPPVTTGVTGHYTTIKNGINLGYDFRVDTGYITTTGRKEVWHTANSSQGGGITRWSPELALLVSLLGLGDGNFVTSTDGVNWTQHTGWDGRFIKAFIWSEQAQKFIYYTMPTLPGGSTFQGVYVPYNTVYSTDGLNWLEQIGAPDVNWSVVLAVPSLGITVGLGFYNDTVSGISHDGGLTWSFTPLPLLSRPQVAAEIGLVWVAELSLFVAVLDNDDGLGALTSPDGINWTKHSTPVGPWHDVAWISQLGLLVACGTSFPLLDAVDDTPHAYSLMTSPDGINWTPVTNVFFPAWMGGAKWSPELNAVVVNAAIQWRRTTRDILFSVASTDGVNWTSMQPLDGVGVWVQELGKYVSPEGWSDGTCGPTTTYYWPYDQWVFNYTPA